VPRRRYAPEAAKQRRDDAILLGVWTQREQCARLAALDQHRARRGLGLQQADRGVAVPEPQPVELVLGLEVRQPQLEHGGRAVGALHESDERAGRREGRRLRVKGQRPTTAEGGDLFGQAPQPGAPRFARFAGLHQSRRQLERHARPVRRSAIDRVGTPRRARTARAEALPFRGWLWRCAAVARALRSRCSTRPFPRRTPRCRWSR
jgi:hypothetical protein